MKWDDYSQPLGSQFHSIYFEPLEIAAEELVDATAAEKKALNGRSYNYDLLFKPYIFVDDPKLFTGFNRNLEAEYQFLNFDKKLLGGLPESVTPSAVISMRFLRHRMFIRGERVAFPINEFLEAVGGLINGIEKIIAPVILFFSFRLFWLYIVQE